MTAAAALFLETGESGGGMDTVIRLRRWRGLLGEPRHCREDECHQPCQHRREPAPLLGDIGDQAQHKAWVGHDRCRDHAGQGCKLDAPHAIPGAVAINEFHGRCTHPFWIAPPVTAAAITPTRAASIGLFRIWPIAPVAPSRRLRSISSSATPVFRVATLDFKAAISAPSTASPVTSRERNSNFCERLFIECTTSRNWPRISPRIISWLTPGDVSLDDMQTLLC